jgi:small membrane protein
MTIIQILFLIFALFAWSRAIIRFWKRDIELGEFIFWSGAWVVVILISLFPDSLTQFSYMAGIERGTDLLIYGGMILMFYMMFRLYVKIDHQNQEMTKIVRNIAMENKKRK